VWALLLWSAGAQTLVITDPAVSDFAGGIGVAPEFEFGAGDRVHLLFRASGFKVDEANLSIAGDYTIDAVDCHGQLFVPPFTGKIAQQFRTLRFDWSEPVRFDFEVPSMPWPGEAKFRVTVRDTIGDRTVRTEIPFLIRSELGEPPPTLSIQRLRWFKSQYDAEALPLDAAYHRGDTISVRFLLGGFRTGINNKYDLQYGIALRSPAKRVILSAPEAAAESKEASYPRTHVDALLSFSLERSIKPGKYSLLISVRDKVGNQQTAAEYEFQIAE
jgi:hypothetical protein